MTTKARGLWPEPQDLANYVQVVVEAALNAGGPLHRELADLVSLASGHGMEAVGIDVETEPWDIDEQRIVEIIAIELAEQIFKVALEHERKSQLTPVH